MEKRRYFKGYYVSYSRYKPNIKSTKENELVNQNLEQNDEHIKSTYNNDSITYFDNVNSDNESYEEVSQTQNGKNSFCEIKPKKETNLNNSQFMENKISIREKNKNKLPFLDKKDKETLKNKTITNRKWAIYIGVSLLLMALLAGISIPVLGSFFVSGNIALTASNFLSGVGGYPLVLIALAGVFVLDLFVSLGIYKYYKSENKKLATITGFLRLIYSLFLGFAIFFLLRINSLSSASAIYNGFHMFYKVWGWGLIVFGLHLIFLGITFNNEGGKKWLNCVIKTLLIVAGSAYIVQYIGILIVANPIVFAAFIESIFIIPMILGEIGYAIWKLIKGGKKKLSN